MSEKKKQLLVDYICGLVIAGFVVIANWGSFGVIHLLCDGCFVAGVLLMGAGGLKAVRNAGGFDMMAYGLKTAVGMYMPWARPASPLQGKEEDFAAYKERKKEARKPAGDLVITGGTFLALAAILLIVYSVMY